MEWKQLFITIFLESFWLPTSYILKYKREQKFIFFLVGLTLNFVLLSRWTDMRKSNRIFFIVRTQVLIITHWPCRKRELRLKKFSLFLHRFLHISVVQGDQPLSQFFIERMKSRGVDIFNKLRQVRNFSIKGKEKTADYLSRV